MLVLEILLVLINLAILVLVWMVFKNVSSKNNTQLNSQLNLITAADLALGNVQIIEAQKQTIAGGLSSVLHKLLEENGKSQLAIQQLLNSGQNNLGSEINQKLSQSTIQLLELTRLELGKLQENSQQSIQILSNVAKDKLDQINLDVQKRLDENFTRNLKSFEEVTKNLGQIEQKAQLMIDSTKSIDKLNNIFGRNSSKAFGSFSENYLESMLRENLDPGSFQTQVKMPFSSDNIDFVITFEDKKLGIDSKFPLTKYTDYIECGGDNLESEKRKQEYVKSVLEMAKSISGKYLKGHFLDVLMLYLPSDSMFSTLTDLGGEFLDKLSKLKVTLVSPSTLFPQLVMISAFQSRVKISQNAEIIISGINLIRKNMLVFRDEFRKLGDKLRQANENYSKAEGSLDNVQRNIKTLEDTEKTSDLLAI